MERAGPPSAEAPGQTYLPPSRRRVPPMPDPVEKKKEKKWSLGGLFRRRKKHAESDSSSAEDEEFPQRKGFLARRRSRRDKRTQRPKIVGTFDHVVVNPLSQAQNRAPDLNGLSASPPQNEFIRDVTVTVRGSRDSLGGSVDRLSNRSSRESVPLQQHKRQDSSVSRNSSGSGSLEGSTARRGKRDLIKARVEAIRDQQRGSSSDECDGFPASPSLSRFRSDDSLSPTQKEGSLSRRSRVARTERYIRRLSRDEESILKREAEMDLRQRLCKSDAEGSFNRKVLSGSNKLGVAVNYHESSDIEPRLLTRTPSATPSPVQSPRVRPKPMLQYSSSVPPSDSLTSTFPPSHYHGPTISRSPPQNPAVRISACPKPYPPRGLSPAPSNRSNESLPVHGLSRSRTEYLPGRQNVVNYESVYNKNPPNHPYEFHHPGQRSHSYENNIHHATLNTPSAIPGTDDVLVVQFPIARPQILQSRSVETTMGRGSSVSPSFFKPGPPPPPPRDPQRRLTSGPGQPDPPRPMSYAFENGSPQTARIEYSLNHPGKTLDHNGNMKTFSFVPQPHIIANIPATGSVWGSYQRRSGSDNQIASPFPQMQQVRAQVATTRPRPSSVTPEAMRPLPQQYNSQGRLPSRTPPDAGRQENLQPFQYFADQQPRSRKPIHIQYNTGSTSDQPYLSDSQVVMMKPPYQDRRNPATSASEFWRQKDQENALKQRKPTSSSKPPLQHTNRSDRSRSNSPRPRENAVPENNRGRSSKIRTAPLTFPVRNTDSVSSLSGQSDISSPIQAPKMHSDGSCYDSCDSSGAHGIDKKKENPNLRPLSMVLENTENQEQTSSSPLNEEASQTLLTTAKNNMPPTPPVRRYSRQSSTSSLEASEWMGDESENQKNQRRSTNLEDALNELEAIYKSLKLGDEDLLDRAERRDLPTVHQQHKENGGWSNSRGAESDSGFNYGYGSSYDSLFESDLSARRQRAPSLRRSGIPDKVMDDMAYRRLNPKERPGSQDVRNVVSQSGSYMLTTPALAQSPGATDSGQPQKSPPGVNEEPDITYDDVVYRSIKHANTTLKISDPQPLFGIPLGPITIAPNSDYLHATPVERYRSTFKPRKVPDVVKDDLAFRNLRKDSQKDASGLPVTDDSGGFVTNPTHSNFSLRKKRAVRSLSANLMSFVHREPLSMAVEEKQQEFEKAQSLSDLPDALQVAQKILEGKEVIGGGPVKLRNLTSGAVNSLGTATTSVDSTVLDPRYGITPVSWIERANLDKALGTGASTSTETLTDSRANLQQQDGINKRSGWQQRLRVYIPPQNDVIQDSGVSRTPDKKETSVHEDKSLSMPDGVPGSPIDESRLEELLTALAREARATSDRLDLELQQLGEETPNLHIQSDKKEELVVDNNQNTIFNSNLNVSASDKTSNNSDLKPFVVITSTAVVDNSTQDNNFQTNLKSISEKAPKGVVDINQTAIVERHFRSVLDKSNKEVRDHNQNITPASSTCVETTETEKNTSVNAADKGLRNMGDSSKLSERESRSTQPNSFTDVTTENVDLNSEKDKHEGGVTDDQKKEDESDDVDTVVIIKQKITLDANQKITEENKANISADRVENDLRNEQQDEETLDQPCTVYRHIQQLTINICNDAIESSSICSGSGTHENTGTSESNAAAAPECANGSEEVVMKQVATIATQTGDGECECADESKTNEDDVSTEPCEVKADVPTTSSGVRSTGTASEGSPPRSAECSCCSHHATRGEDCEQQNCVVVPVPCGTSSSYTQLNCLSLAEPVVSLSQPYNTTMSDRRLALGSRAVAGDSTSGSSEGGSTAESRMARYKEERRRQLATQFGAREVDAPPQRRYISRTTSGTTGLRSPEGGGSSSNAEQSPGGGVMRVRTTRASRLRAAAVSSDAVPASSVKDGAPIFVRPKRVLPSSDTGVGRRLATPSTATTGSSDKEKSPMSSDASAAASPRREKDKSSKRKSNLNRSLAAEEVVVIDLNEDSTVRRRRRVNQTNGIGLLELNRGLLTTQPEQTVSRATSPRKVTPEPATLKTMPDPAGVLKKSPDSPSRSSPRVTTLDRKISAGRVSPRSTVDSESSRKTNGVLENVRKTSTRPNSVSETSVRSSLRMTKRTSSVPAGRSVPAKHSSPPPEDKAEEASKKLDVLRETVARLDQLPAASHMVNSESRNDTTPEKQPSPPPDVRRKIAPIAAQETILSSSGTASQPSSDANRSNTASPVRQQSSILKKKSLEEPSVVVLPPTIHPVSILKRKTSQDEANSNIVPPPVTFSPSVKEQTSSRRGGILKKRASLDESEVLRRRSCSPDMNYTAGRENSSDFKPILKRRSSMEELGRRTQSPDPQPHSILKRRTSREDELDDRTTSSPEPQGILKRKSNVSSSSSSNSTSPHVSISASVMMTVAGMEGIDFISESTDQVRPILKKKSSSEDNTTADSSSTDTPRPILKKKASIEMEEREDRPKKPILKTSRKHSRDDLVGSSSWDEGMRGSPSRCLKLRSRSVGASDSTSGSDCEVVKPILKHSSEDLKSKERSASPRLHLSFSDNEPIREKNDSRVGDGSRNSSPVTLRRSSKPSQATGEKVDSELRALLIKRRSLDVDSRSVESDSAIHFRRSKSPLSDRDSSPRPMSVAERIMTMENFLEQESVRGSTGAVPKRFNMVRASRNKERFHTQPITQEELEASARLQSKAFPEVVGKPAVVNGISDHKPEEKDSDDQKFNTTELKRVSSPPDEDSDISYQTPPTSPTREINRGNTTTEKSSQESSSPVKMEGTEEPEVEDFRGLCKSNSVSAKASMFAQLEEEMKIAARESSSRRSFRGSGTGGNRYRERKEESSRFATQPVTQDEVEEAVRQNQRKELGASVSVQGLVSQSDESKDEDDPSKLSLAERVRLFNQKSMEERLPKTAGVGPTPMVRKRLASRFKTQPVTTEEMETAVQKISPLAATLVKPPDPELLGNISVRAAKEKMFEHSAQLLSKSGSAPKLVRANSKDSPSPKTCAGDAEVRPKGILKHTRELDSRRTSLLDMEKEAETESESEVKGILKTAGSGGLGTQTPELESFRHLKSVLKKETSVGESHSENEIISATNEHLRSILKPESTKWASQEDDSSVTDGDSSSSESSECDQPLSNSHISPSLRNNLRGGSGIDLVGILHDVEAHACKQRQAPTSSPNNKQKLGEEKIKNLKNLSQEKENQKDAYVKKKLDDYLSTRKKSIDVKETQVCHSKTVEKSSVNQKKIECKQVTEDVKKKMTKKVMESRNDLIYQKKIRRQLEELQHLSPAAETTPPTSDGDTSSSGGREVRCIIRNEAVARRRQAAINKQLREQAHLSGQPPPPHLLKSRSHSSVPACGTSVRQDEDDSLRTELHGLQRSSTQPLGKELEADTMSGASIKDRMAALEKSGSTDWKKRFSRLNPEDDLSLLVTNNKLNEIHSRPHPQLSPPKHGPEQTDDDLDNSLLPGSILADRLGKLDAATQGWKKRIGPTDAVKFSVAGRMLLEQEKSDVTLTTLLSKNDAVPTPSPVTSPLPAQLKSISSERQKRTPRAARFRSKTAHLKDASSTPVSPQKESTISFKRSISAPGGDEENGLSASDQNEELVSPKVAIPRADDETFREFYRSVTTDKLVNERLVIHDEDLDKIVSQSNQLLVQKRTVRVQRRNISSRNPIKALAARTDIQEEYIEVKTGLAEKELKRMQVEKLAKHSSLAVEALAGLASKEDFTAVSLKKASPSSSAMLPYKDLMLIHIKGRRHVQTRLVEPVASSINDGDNYVLVTPTEVYNWVGRYSNVIERSRGAEVAQHIQQRKDLGCNGANQVITISSEKVTCSTSHVQRFWTLLGAGPDLGQASAAVKAGHPDEDELYETSMIATNMVFEVQDDELVPVEDCWGSIPRISILDPAKILVLNFGSELYVWNGKNATLDARRSAQRLARELWEEGYDYSECDVCPLNIAASLGGRSDSGQQPHKGTARPSWALLAKVNQHMETILFREKFLDWPDFSRVIRSKSLEDSEKQADASIDVKPCDAKAMLEHNASEPDLELEGVHLGRGLNYFDPETHRHSEISTLGVTVWHILEYEHTQLPETSVGQFHAGDSYVVRWQYSITVTGRELGSGQPSRHSMVGRDRCAYFCWQGEASPLNEQGAAALLTVELDHERGPQVRVIQGAEPPAFLNLFSGKMVVHSGRREPDEEELEEERSKGPWKLYISRGETEQETVLVQVPCSMRQLRSRACLVLINITTGAIHIWYGSKATKNTRQITLKAVDQLKERRPVEFCFKSGVSIVINEHHEGSEKKEFFRGIGGDSRQLYMSLINRKQSFTHTPRLFHLTSVSGVFTATEVLGPYRCSSETVAYPFLQVDLYSANQPALFLLDNHDELWLWQGWWPENGDDNGGDNSNQTGSGAVRWQAERRAAMQTALDYWRLSHPGQKVSSLQAYLVWAGLEPLRFTNLFPIWTDRDDIAEINIRDGKKPGEVLTVEVELARLTRSTYPPAQLLQRPLPDGVDPTRLELYLDPSHFQELLGMSKEEFMELPVWRQKEVKKDVGLF